MNRITRLIFNKTKLLLTVIFIILLENCSIPFSPNNIAPKADFVFDLQYSNGLPAIVNFNSTSINATSYQWYFEDGNTSSDQNPTNSYLVADTYHVKLVVTSDAGIDSITKPILISAAKPKASFSLSIIDIGNYPVHVNVHNTSVGAVNYKWVFDNGDTSILQDTIDSFFTAKTYNIKLIAANSAGSDSITIPVIISINKPKAAFNYSILNKYTLLFNSSCKNTSMHSASNSWNFRDGRTSTIRSTLHKVTRSESIYTIKRINENLGDLDSTPMQVRSNSYFQSCLSFEEDGYNKNAREIYNAFNAKSNFDTMLDDFFRKVSVAKDA